MVDLDIESKPGLSRTHWFILLVLLLLYVVSRLLNLSDLPPFIDEAIHIGFTRLIRSGITGAGSGDGRWLSILIMTPATFLPVDPLLSTRLVSMAGGLITIWAIVLTGRELFSTREALLAVAFFVFLPFVLFYNRLALSDGIATAIGAWILLVAIRCVRRDRGAYSMLLAVLLMASFLAKSSSILFLTIPILSVAVLLPRNQWRSGLRKIGPSLLASLIIIPVLFISDIVYVDQIGGQTGDNSTIIDLSLIGRNLEWVGGWGWSLLTPPIALLFLLVLIWALYSFRNRAVFYLGSVIGAALLPYILLANTLYPRYLSFTLVPLVILLASFCFWSMDWFQSRVESQKKGKLLAGLLLVVLFIWPALLIAQIVTTPDTAPLPAIIKRQYINGWPAGYGSREMTTFLEDLAEGGELPVQVLRPVFWTHTHRGGLDLYRQGDENMTLVDMGLDIPAEIEMAKEQRLTGRRTLFILDSLHPPSVQLFELVRPYFQVERIWYNMKPGATGGLEIWEINIPPDEAGLGRPGE